MLPTSGTPSTSNREQREHRHFEYQEDGARKDERQQERALAHGRHEEATQQALLAHVGDTVTDGPQTRAHQVHAEQTWKQPVDVARAGIAHFLDAIARRIRAGLRERFLNSAGARLPPADAAGRSAAPAARHR
jgi:hypothetical protein